MSKENPEKKQKESSNNPQDFFDNLKKNLKKEVTTSEAYQKFENLKEDVLSRVVFEGTDQNGKVFEKVKVKDIVDNPWNFVKGLALEFSDSFPMLQEIYKFVTTLDTDEIGINDDERTIANLDTEYLLGKNIKVEDLEKYGLTPRENQLSKDIIDEGGCDIIKILNFYEKNELGVKNMSREDFLLLGKESVCQAKRFGLPTEYYVPYILGMTKMESSFKINAFNASGASGIHQHMPQFMSSRYEKNKDYLKERGMDYEFAGKGFATIKGLSQKSDRSKWPMNMWKYASDLRVQSAFTGQLTHENLQKILQKKNIQGVGQMSLDSFFRETYFCHNMGSGNLELLYKYQYGNGNLSELREKHGNTWVYRRVAEEKPWEKVVKNSKHAHQLLYGDQNIS